MLAWGGLAAIALGAVWYETGPQARRRRDAEVRSCVQRVRLSTASVERARREIAVCLTERFGWTERRASGEVALLEVVAPGDPCVETRPERLAACVELVHPVRESAEQAVGN